MVTAESPALSVHDRYDEGSIRSFRERGWWQVGSAAALLERWAQATPTRRFVSDGTTELDCAAVHERARGLGATLLRRGVRPGDRVAMQLPNWAEFVVGYLAIARIGAELGPYPDPDLPHAIVYTSGTESTAKGCVHIWNTLDHSARGLAQQIFKTRPEDVMFMPSPVAHATGPVVGVLGPLAVGAETHRLNVMALDAARTAGGVAVVTAGGGQQLRAAVERYQHPAGEGQVELDRQRLGNGVEFLKSRGISMQKLPSSTPCRLPRPARCRSSGSATSPSMPDRMDLRHSSGTG